jgi:heat shock protein HtpX
MRVDDGATLGCLCKGALGRRRTPYGDGICGHALFRSGQVSYIRRIGIGHADEVEGSMNVVKTGMLLAALTALFGVVGYAVGGGTGMVVALLVAAGTNLFAWWNSDRMALSAHNAQEVDAASAPELFQIVGELAQRASLPMPRVYILQEDQPNAFATGRNPQNSAVAISTGLLQILNRDEIAGVMAHELAHIKNRDTLLMTISATVAGAISTVAQFGFLFGGRSDGRSHPVIGLLTMLLAPIAAAIIQFAISRSREYVADRDGGLISGRPDALASALMKLEAGARRTVNVPAEQHPATAPLFIVNPLSGGGIDSMFSTHPSVENRVAALQQLAAEMGRGAPGGFRDTRSAAAAWGRPVGRGPWGR